MEQHPPSSTEESHQKNKQQKQQNAKAYELTKKLNKGLQTIMHRENIPEQDLFSQVPT